MLNLKKKTIKINIKSYYQGHLICVSNDSFYHNLLMVIILLDCMLQLQASSSSFSRSLTYSFHSVFLLSLNSILFYPALAVLHGLMKIILILSLLSLILAQSVHHFGHCLNLFIISLVSLFFSRISHFLSHLKPDLNF
jgi:hypothetical protein